MVAGAIRSLVEDPDGRPLGLHGPRGRSFCGELVDLSPSELEQATLAAPWSRSSGPQPTVRPLPITPLPSNGESPQSPTTTTRPIIPSGAELETLATLPSRSLGELRQKVAARLGRIEGNDVQEVSFRIFVNAQNVELSGFSSGVRGGLSGRGSLDVQIDATCPGPMTKADVEAK